MVHDLSKFTLNINDLVIVRDNKMTDNGRKGKILDIEDLIDSKDKLYVIELSEEKETKEIKGKMTTVVKPTKITVLAKEQLRKDV